jgi:hypothetical protein
LQKKVGEGLHAITKGGEMPTIAEVCLMLRTVVSLAECARGNGHGREVQNEYGVAADLPQPCFVTGRIELIPGLDLGWRYFGVPKEEGSIHMEHSGQALPAISAGTPRLREPYTVATIFTPTNISAGCCHPPSPTPAAETICPEIRRLAETKYRSSRYMTSFSQAA